MVRGLTVYLMLVYCRGAGDIEDGNLNVDRKVTEKQVVVSQHNTKRKSRGGQGASPIVNDVGSSIRSGDVEKVTFEMFVWAFYTRTREVIASHEV